MTSGKFRSLPPGNLLKEINDLRPQMEQRSRHIYETPEVGDATDYSNKLVQIMKQQKTEMETTIAFIEIIGTLIACSEGVRDDWRNVAHWLSVKLKETYGSQVQVKYYDLFDDDIPDLPVDARLPVVIINGVILTMGEKISVARIKKEIQGFGISPEIT